MDRIYKKGDAIGQMVVTQVVPIEFEVVQELSESDRGMGGFGSTDKVIAGPVNLDERPSTLAEKFRESNYTPERKYSDVMKEQQRNFQG